MLGPAIALIILGATPLPEASLIDTAASLCKNARKPVNKAFLGELMALEVKHKVPTYARGITLAAACRESGYRANGRKGDGGKAVGILQMWPWWERAYPFKRTQALKAVDVWLTHINKSTKKARRKCKKPWRAWLIAQAWISSGPQKWRCRYSRHYRLLKRWRRLVRKSLSASSGPRTPPASKRRSR